MAFDQTDTVVSFGANTQELEAGAKRVSDSLNGMFGGVSATFENLRNAIPEMWPESMKASAG